MAEAKDYLGHTFGNYQAVAVLHQTFSVAVYLAQHLFLKRRTAVIKLLHTPRRDTPQHRERFFQEAEFLDMLRHPAILLLLDVGLHDDQPYVLTEYAPNGSLQDQIERQFPAPLPLPEALTILSRIGEALHYSHQRDIVHGDLKPANVLFNARGEALLADFGLAVRLTAPSLHQDSVPGTLHYLAPEKLDGIITKEGDQYSLGCMAYELVTGRQPFTDFSVRGVMLKHLREEPLPPTQLNPALPLSIEQAILKALAKAPADRHADVATFIAALSPHSPSSFNLPLPFHAQSDEAHDDQKTKEDWLDEGVEYARAKRYEQALTAYEAAMALDPTDAYALIGRGLVLSSLTRYEEALETMRQAIALDPMDAYAYVSEGLILRTLERDEEALLAYQQAIERDPHDGDAHLGKGLVLERMRRDEEALLAYEEALACNDSSTVVWHHKAALLDRLSRGEEAQHAYEKARQLTTIAELRAGASA